MAVTGTCVMNSFKTQNITIKKKTKSETGLQTNDFNFRRAETGFDLHDIAFSKKKK